MDSHTYQTLFLLILIIDIPTIKPTTIPRVATATPVLNTSSVGTNGCDSQVPGKVYTDGFDAKIIFLFFLDSAPLRPVPVQSGGGGGNGRA